MHSEWYELSVSAAEQINAARQALVRMTSQLRTAAAVDPNSPANECTLITSGVSGGLVLALMTCVGAGY